MNIKALLKTVLVIIMVLVVTLSFLWAIVGAIGEESPFEEILGISILILVSLLMIFLCYITISTVYKYFAKKEE